MFSKDFVLGLYTGGALAVLVAWLWHKRDLAARMRRMVWANGSRTGTYTGTKIT
jgi:hypothetical protein